ncbi:MAG: GldG family protein [Treponema sp.]|nr:GldG family protein [Treponema sp.]
MKKPSTAKALYRYNLFNAFTSPAFYILAILYTLIIPINFFIRHQFFTTGSTDLTLFFSDVPFICILIIPALCYRQHYSIFESFAPISSLAAIWVRFLSCLSQFILMNLMLLPSILLINLFGSLDGGQVFTSYILLISYGAAIIALTLCIGELITNKVSAFVISAIILAILNSAHLFAVYVNLGSFLSSIFKEISFAWHFDASSKGLLDSRDLLWLLFSAAFFIFLADFINQRKKGRKFRGALLARSLGIEILFILCMLNGLRYYTRLDFSQSKIYSLSDYTKELLGKIDSPIKITYFRSQSLSRLYPQVRDVSDFLSTYTNASNKINLTIRNPDNDQELTSLLQNYGIQSQPLRSVTASSTEFTNVYSAIVIEYKGNAETIPFTMDASSLEYDLDGRIKHLLSGSRRRVQIIVGNGMDIYEDYNYVIPWLNAQGFECNPLDISSSDFSQKLLNESGPLLLMGDSQIPIEAAISIEDYILRGNNALLAVSPFSSAIDDNWYITQNKKTNIVEIAENWGVGFENKIAADISSARITMSSDDYTETQLLNYPMWLSLLTQENAVLGADLFWANPLRLSGNAKPLLVTSSQAYTYDLDLHSPEKLVENNPFLLAEDTSVAEKEKGTLVVAAKISGKLQGLFNVNEGNAEVIVIPDQYFVNTLMQQYLGQDNNFRNFNLLTDLLLKLNNEEELAQLHSRMQRNTSLYKISDSAQLQKKERLLFIIAFIIIPLLIAFAGLFFCIFYKRRVRK